MIIELSHIKKSFGRKTVLKDVNLSVKKGALIGITGENGSGKSTILKILTGSIRADSGSVKINGRMGYSPQEVNVFNQLTAKENFKYFSRAYGLSEEECEERLDHLSTFFGFKDQLNDPVKILSGGTQQKLNLCLALLHRPEILILDEPYSGLDIGTYQHFWKYTEQLRESGVSLLIVAHLITNIDVFDRIYELKNGKLL